MVSVVLDGEESSLEFIEQPSVKACLYGSVNVFLTLNNNNNKKLTAIYGNLWHAVTLAVHVFFNKIGKNTRKNTMKYYVTLHTYCGRH